MMIDAIFIQSWHGEIVNGRLEKFLTHLHHTPRSDIPVYTFVDQTTLHSSTNKNAMEQLAEQRLTQFVVIDDTTHNNPQTVMYYRMMKYMTDSFKHVLLLEADCTLKPNFDKMISNDLTYLPIDWWVYGSTYSGDYNDVDSHRRCHMNGVAVYNRSDSFMRFLEYVYVQRGGLDNKSAYDWLFAIEFFNSKHQNEKRLFDSEYIINLSPSFDRNEDHRVVKPDAVVVHQKE
jgi:hypothetical protein